jgi:hypothetical protein
MVRRTLKFSPVSYGRDLSGDPKRYDAWRKEVVAVFKPLVDRTWAAYADFEIDLDSPKVPELTAAMKDLMKRKVAKPSASAWLTERLVGDEDTCVEWFAIAPVAEFEEGRRPDAKKWPALDRYSLQTTEAHRYKPGVHLAGYAVSEQVRALIERAGLTGVELLWVPDTGRYAAPQWYMPIATEPHGRGVYHPWFDPARFTRQKYRHDRTGRADQPQDPLWRNGVRFLVGWQRRPGVTLGDPTKDAALALFVGEGACIDSYRRVLRRYLPSTDFAYAWYWVEPDWHRPWRGVACNRRTRDLLIAEGLATEADFTGVEVLDRAYKGAEILDKLPGGPAGPGPYLSPEELAEVRAELDRWHAEFLANPKPERGKPDAAAAMKAAKKPRKKKRPRVTFDGAASQEEIDKAAATLSVPIPEAWQEFLRTAGGANIRKCVLADMVAGTGLYNPQEIADSQGDHDWLTEGFDPDGQRGLLWVGETEFGDSVALETAKMTAKGECPVLLVSHETFDVDREWDTVAAFLQEVLEEPGR